MLSTPRIWSSRGRPGALRAWNGSTASVFRRLKLGRLGGPLAGG